jgi:hypothetical protein
LPGCPLKQTSHFLLQCSVVGTNISFFDTREIMPFKGSITLIPLAYKIHTENVQVNKVDCVFRGKKSCTAHQIWSAEGGTGLGIARVLERWPLNPWKNHWIGLHSLYRMGDLTKFQCSNDRNKPTAIEMPVEPRFGYLRFGHLIQSGPWDLLFEIYANCFKRHSYGGLPQSRVL